MSSILTIRLASAKQPRQENKTTIVLHHEGSNTIAVTSRELRDRKAPNERYLTACGPVCMHVESK